MNIRAIEKNDYEEVKRIHKQFFEREFSFPDFLTNYLSAFVVESNGKIVVAGGVRTIAESVLITDKNVNIVDRRQALYQALYASMFIAKNNNFDKVHAFVQDKAWEKHLLRKGFQPVNGNALYLEI